MLWQEARSTLATFEHINKPSNFSASCIFDRQKQWLHIKTKMHLVW